MGRIVLAGVLSMGLGLSPQAAPDPARPADGQEVKILAHGAWPHVPVYSPAAPARKQQQWVFRDEKELAQAAGPHGARMVARALKVDAIDFNKQMLVAVADGTQPLVGVSGGGPPSAPNRIEISRADVDEDGKVLTVRWRLVPREAGADVITAPLQAALLERFDGEVRFRRESAPVKDKEEEVRGKEVKVLGRASWPDGWKAEEPARQWVVRRSEDLIDPRLKAPEDVLERMRQANADRYAKALKVDAIDFNKQMVIGVSGGVQPGGGYRVEVTKVEADAEHGRMTVHWVLHSPGAGKDVGSDPTHPAEVALVGQFTGEVRFEQEASANP